MPSADFTIADVLAWARTKPADEEYDFYDASACAVAQFGRATGREHLIDLGILSDRAGMPADLPNAVQGTGSFQLNRWTFGALVTRLEKLCPETPVTASNWQAIDAYLTDIEDVARERVQA